MVYEWCDGSGRVEITLTQAQIDAVCNPGPNDAEVSALDKAELNAEHVRMALREYGAWDDAELADELQNSARIYWIAAWDCFDNPEDYQAA